jgi:hypothetical protein
MKGKGKREEWRVLEVLGAPFQFSQQGKTTALPAPLPSHQSGTSVWSRELQLWSRGCGLLGGAVCSQWPRFRDGFMVPSGRCGMGSLAGTWPGQGRGPRT